MVKGQLEHINLLTFHQAIVEATASCPYLALPWQPPASSKHNSTVPLPPGKNPS
jgi:hypothetical protein